MHDTPASLESVVGVCYLTATSHPGADASELVVRFVMTRDVGSSEVSIEHARGFDAACSVLRSWMTAMCRPKSAL
jgi:hypothetical protein